MRKGKKIYVTDSSSTFSMSKKNSVKGVYIFRLIAIVSLISIILLGIFGTAGGMIPIWSIVLVGSIILGTRGGYKYFFSKKWFKIPFFILLAVFIVSEFMIIGVGLYSNNEVDSDYVIVLGAKVNKDEVSLTLKYRLDKAYSYLTDHENTVAILSGAKGEDELISEALAMKNYLVEKGIEEDRLIMEDESTNTHENLINSFEIIDNKSNLDTAKVSVLTNRFHVLRARIIAYKIGKNVDGIGAKNYVFLDLNYYFREFFAIIKDVCIQY